MESEERNCMRLAQQFVSLRKSTEKILYLFTTLLFQASTWSVAAHLESYLLHDDKEIDQ